jgi:hypothetical protein
MDIAAYVGIDWASTTHYAFVMDADGRTLGHRAFAHSGDGLADLARWIRRTADAEPTRIAIGIEVPHGPVVESLMNAGFLVHALNPKQLDRFRDRFTMAGAKDDRRDALVLADALRTDRRFYRFLDASWVFTPLPECLPSHRQHRKPLVLAAWFAVLPNC